MDGRQEWSEDEGNSGLQGHTMVPRRVSRVRQFAAVLHKNYLLQTRASRTWARFGVTGWLSLLLEILVPGIFFALMCIPKHYLNPQHIPQQLSPAYDLDIAKWGLDYMGPAALHGNRALLLYAPNNTATAAVMAAFAKSVSCPGDAAKKGPASTSFFAYFRPTLPSAPCAAQPACLTDSDCSQHLLGTQIIGYSTVEEALERASREADTVDAVVALDEFSGGSMGYTLRLNHTELPSTRGRLANLDVRPDDQYQKYWLFANLQLHLDRAILGLAANQAAGLPALVDVQIKPFPWPACTLDIGAAAAAAAFNLLIVFSFLSPTRGMVAAIVREKELRLREGMRILGLKDAAYWASWALSHFATLALSGLICALISLYPFRHSSFTVMLALFFLIAAALIAFAYFMSTLFSTSRVAGIASAQIFAISMVPGYLMPTFQPYGGLGWYFACLAPPSCISLFASALVKIEVSQHGLHWNSLGLNVTNESAFPFSALTVFIMLAVDVVFYSLLAWYLDRVIPSEVGQNLPWYFPFQRSYWRPRKAPAKATNGPGSAASASSLRGADPTLAVSIRDLQKVFSTTEGVPKRAVDGLTLDIYQSQITALLGANGAGKTTTISILTGMLAPSGGDAFVHGQSILQEMGAIRQNLGVCPQFDILWPDITVREHLHLYAAIKGYSFKATHGVAITAARDVGLEDKLDTMAGSLSGGQRRKLSVAIAFLGSPTVVFLDEPTSGMDPYSRRFTWEIIKRHKAGRAVVLTTHSMEEADLLCDRIAIMADGRLAALGTSMDLKSRFGVGYTLTVAKTRSQQGSEATLGQEGRSSRTASLREVGSQQSISDMSDGDTEVDALVKRHVPHAKLALRAAAELTFKLPKEDAARFPDMLRELEAGKAELGVSSYGLAETTLEEVFLNVASRGAAADTSQAKIARPAVDDSTAPAEERPLLGEDSDVEGGVGTSELAAEPHREPLRGGRLYLQQLWALFVKRAVSARRDRMALVTQLLVPIALVLVALLAGRASMSFPQEPAAPVSREWSLFGAPTVFGASPGARANTTALNAFLEGYPASDLTVTEAQKLWAPPFWSPVNGTLDGYLLDHWFQRRPSYDALFLTSWANTAQVLDPSIPVQYTILVNQTATHAVPAALNAANTALLRAVTGRADANISVVNYPLPTLMHEAAIQVSQATGDLLTVLCTTMAFALLSASFALFLVREKECQSKHVQLVSGAPTSAFWLATFLWDLLSFCIPAAGILICYAAFNLPSFQGPRLAALAAIFWVFAVAALPLSYLLHFFFEDEMKALQVMNTILFLSGYLGFLASWILDLLYMFTHKPGIHKANQITQCILRTVSPHFNLARGMYEVSQTHKQEEGQRDASPWAWKPTGQWLFFFAVQAVVYGTLVLLMEAGWGGWVLQRLQRGWLKIQTCCGARGGGYRAAATEEDWPEDEDVQAERLALQDGKTEGFQVLLAGLRKDYPVGLRNPPVRALRGVWAGIPQGECFGLLGVNGAGKTTTFKILTGEVLPDAGDAFICGRSVLRSLAAARRMLGYCPQFSALPGALTGREVLRMYARLRGVPPSSVEAAVHTLLKRLDFTQYADRACESYSGGNKRKLSVAVALVGEPPVVMLDEPSTGMDPGAKRFLWDIIQAQVIDRGHTVLLTSHSMEECEALCTHIAIMRAGQFRCLGAVQHLKNRFGAGYVLQLRLRPGQASAPALDAVKARCPAAELSQDTGGRLSFRIPQQGLDLPALFEGMENSRQSLGIDEYSISQTTLEHVFIELAQQN